MHPCQLAAQARAQVLGPQIRLKTVFAFDLVLAFDLASQNPAGELQRSLPRPPRMPRSARVAWLSQICSKA